MKVFMSRQGAAADQSRIAAPDHIVQLTDRITQITMFRGG
jgi:hypothetical protein